MSALWLTIALTAGSVAAVSSNFSIKFPSTQNNQSLKVAADFLGFGIETAFLPQYNTQFSENLVDSLRSRISVPPVIRVGGTSGDRLTFDPHQKNATMCLGGEAQGCPSAYTADFVLGPSYFDAFKGLKSAKMTFQALMNLSSNLTTLEYVSQAYAALGADRVSAIAMGNEVNFEYGGDLQEYVDRANALELAIIKNLSLPIDQQKIFVVIDLASDAVASQKPYTIPNAFNAGLNRNRTLTAAAHCYQDESKHILHSLDDLQTDLMNHTAIASKLANYRVTLKYLNSNDTEKPSIPLVLSEVNSANDPTGKLSDSFSAALWAVDFHLYAMSMGVQRVSIEQRPGVERALWDPLPHNTTLPVVKSPYYAEMFVAGFIGNDSKDLAVQNMDLSTDLASAYAMYQEDLLQRIALVNLKQWSASSGTTRCNQTFDLDVPANVSMAFVQSLRAGGGAEVHGFDVGGSAENITWAGEQWSYTIDNGKGHRIQDVAVNIPVQGGKVSITVADSEAAIVTLGYALPH